MRDGRHANNPWLQELPDPVTKVTWGNYAAVAPALAARHGLEDGDVIALVPSAGKARLELPVLVQPGQARAHRSRSRSATAAARPARSARGVGVNVYPLAARRRGRRRSTRPG